MVQIGELESNQNEASTDNLIEKKLVIDTEFGAHVGSVKSSVQTTPRTIIQINRKPIQDEEFNETRTYEKDGKACENGPEAKVSNKLNENAIAKLAEIVALDKF